MSISVLEVLFLGLGIAAIIEGLVLALAPLRFEDLLRAMSEITSEQRRLIGLLIAVGGLGIVWIVL